MRFKIRSLALAGFFTLTIMSPAVADAPGDVVTLYCDVTLQSSGAQDQFVFTVDYRANQIYVVKGQRSGTVLMAKAITPGAIEFPDYNTLDFFRDAGGGRSGGGTERINRATGAYESDTFMVMPPMGTIRFTQRGTCKPGPLVAMPKPAF